MAILIFLLRPMPFYNLLVVETNQTLATPAPDKGYALAIFGKKLGQKLSLRDSDGAVARYLLDDWECGPHWVKPTIPVFATPTNK